MLASFAHQDVVVIHPSYGIERGSKVAYYNRLGAQRVIIPNCVLGVVDGLEEEGGSSTQYVLFMPTGYDINHEDAVEYNGKRYAVEGDALFAESASGALDYVQVALKRWDYGE